MDTFLCSWNLSSDEMQSSTSHATLIYSVIIVKFFLSYSYNEDNESKIVVWHSR